MILNLCFGLLVMVLCLIMQCALTALLIRYYNWLEPKLDFRRWWSSMRLLSWVLTILILGTFAQIAAWAELFILMGEFESFEEAVYHSAVNFATLGYGDIVMSDAHKLLGPLQAVNGVLMIGVSTGTLSFAIQNIIKKTMSALNESKG